MSTKSRLSFEICSQEDKYMRVEPILRNFPIVQGHRAHTLNPVMRARKRSIGEITACFGEDLYLESQLRHKFSGMGSKLFHVSCELVATKTVGACHHKLIACHCLKPPVKRNARLPGLKLTRSIAIPESCHLSKGIAT